MRIFKNIFLVTASFCIFANTSFGQKIISQCNVVQIEVQIPVNVNEACVPIFNAPGSLQLACEFDIGFKPKEPYSHRIKSDGDLYYEHDFKIVGQTLIVTFTDAAWLDHDFVDGEELKFKSEVIDYFSKNKISLIFTYTGPEVLN